MSTIPEEFMSEDESGRQSARSADGDAEQVSIAIDLYGLKLRVPAPVLDSPSPETVAPPPTAKTWMAVWLECRGHLQQTIISMVELLAAIPSNTTTIVNSLGSLTGSFSEFARRIARGRAKVDHREDEKIADAECEVKALDNDQALSESVAALRKLEEWRAKLEARGIKPVMTETPEGYLIVVVAPPGTESKLVEETYNKLMNFRSASTSDGEDNDSLESLNLSPRVVSSLRQAHIVTVSELAKFSRDHLVTIPGIGPKSAATIVAALRSRKLKNDIDDIPF